MLSVEALVGVIGGLLLTFGFVGQAIDLPTTIVSVGWRLGVGILALALVFRSFRGEQALRFALLFAPWLVAVVISLGIFKSAEAAQDVARQCIMVGFGVIVFATSHDTGARKIAVSALIVVALAGVGYSLSQVVPAFAHGWSFQAARDLKTKTFATGFGANSVCYTALVATLGLFRSPALSRRMLFATTAFLGLSSFLLASRAPIIALVAGGIVGWVVSRATVLGFFNRRPWLAWPTVASLWAGTLAAFFANIHTIAYADFARDLAGRAALWQIAIVNFWKNPILGSGPHTYTEVIRANLGAAHFSADYERDAIYALQGGGVHNVWLNVLTERGVIGFAGLFLAYTLLLAHALRYGQSLPASRRFPVMLLLCYMLLRGMVEISGLFSYADGALDAVVMLSFASTLPQIPQTFRARNLYAEATGRAPA